MIAATLREARTIRERCANITAAVDAGNSAHFSIDRKALSAAAEIVVATTREPGRSHSVP